MGQTHAICGRNKKGQVMPTNNNNNNVNNNILIYSSKNRSATHRMCFYFEILFTPDEVRHAQGIRVNGHIA